MKTDVLAKVKSDLLAAQDGAVDAALSGAYDGGALDQKASDGTLSQADLDAAVKAATDPLNAKIAQDASDLAAASAKAASDLAAVQSALDAMTLKEGLEEKAVADVSAKIDQVQASFDAIKAIFAPAPVPPSA